MASDVTLKIDADTAAFITKIARMAEAQEKVNKSFLKGANQLTGGLEKALVKVFALKEGLLAAGRALNGMSDKAAQLSQATGRSSISMGNSLAKLGFKLPNIGAAVQAIESMTGGASIQEREGFLGALSGANQQLIDKRLPGLTTQQSMTLTSMFNLGGEAVFGPAGEDITRLVGDRRGGLMGGGDATAAVNRMLAKKFGVSEENAFSEVMNQLPGRTMEELRTRDYERQSELIVRDKTGDGQRARRIQAERSSRNAGSFLQNLFGEVPALSDALRFTQESIIGQQYDERHGGSSIGRAVGAMTDAIDGMRTTNQRKILRQDANGEAPP